MKVKKVKLITEGAQNVNGVQFLNTTEDQFPYVESAINALDDNFNWWKENWGDNESMINFRSCFETCWNAGFETCWNDREVEMDELKRQLREKNGFLDSDY